ncbi:GyrI-like domain-containing protein [Flavobacterium sp.]|uniref:GyrI-like domain-containing protein n=1 Tax=Flavobacterium sp. TaxID=239 RepID=UPI003D2A5154
MKITKYILLLLLLLSIAFIVFIATQPNEYEIKREKMIATSKDNVFNYVNDITTWEDWFNLKDLDPSTSISYTETTSGINSGFTWNSSTSNGKIKTTEFTLNKSINQDFYLNEELHKISWLFTETNKGTKVNWSMKGKLSFKWKFNALLKNGMDDVFGDIFQKGIDQIEKYLVNELESMKITHQGIVTKHATNFIQQKDSCSIDDFQLKSKKMLQNMIEFVENNEIKLSGLPFVMIDKRDENLNSIKFAMCVPVEEEILTTEGSEISGNRFDEFLAYKSTLTGDYKHLKKARKKAIDELLKLNYLQDNSNKYIEIYKVSLPKVKNPSQWETEIYFPVKKKVIKPTIVNPIEIQTNTELNSLENIE